MRTLDVINEIINQSIDYRNIYNDESYYTSFYSINKLIYYAQIEMLKKYNSSLIDDVILADKTGPFIEKTMILFSKYNFDKIIEKQTTEITLPPMARTIIKNVIRKYGKLSDREIGIIVKRETPWLNAINNKETNEITNEMLIESTKQIENQTIKKLKKQY